MQRNRARSQTAHTVHIYIYKHGNHMHFINITVFITSVRFMVVNLFAEWFGFFEIMGEHLLKIQENNIQKFFKKRKHANVSMFISIFSLFLSFLFRYVLKIPFVWLMHTEHAMQNDFLIQLQKKEHEIILQIP